MLHLLMCHSCAGFKSLFSNFAGASSTLSGPVGVVAAGADAVKQDPAGLFQYAALINVNLAVVNTLPLPVRCRVLAGMPCMCTTPRASLLLLLLLPRQLRAEQDYALRHWMAATWCCWCWRR